MIEGECITLGVLLRLRHWSKLNWTLFSGVFLAAVLIGLKGVCCLLNVGGRKEFLDDGESSTILIGYESLDMDRPGLPLLELASSSDSASCFDNLQPLVYVNGWVVEGDTEDS